MKHKNESIDRLITIISFVAAVSLLVSGVSIFTAIVADSEIMAVISAAALVIGFVGKVISDLLKSGKWKMETLEEGE